MGRSKTGVALLATAVMTLAGCGQGMSLQPPGTAGSPSASVSTSVGASVGASPGGSPGTTPAPGNGLGSLETAYEQIITKALPSIVQITTSESLGSGVVFDTAGHIVTNAHVVGSSRRVEVTLATGGTPGRPD